MTRAQVNRGSMANSHPVQHGVFVHEAIELSGEAGQGGAQGGRDGWRVQLVQASRGGAQAVR